MLDAKLLQTTEFDDGDLVFVVVHEAGAEDVVALQGQLDEHFQSDRFTNKDILAIVTNFDVELHHVKAPGSGEILWVGMDDDADQDDVDHMKALIEEHLDPKGEGGDSTVMVSNFTPEIVHMTYEQLIITRAFLDGLIEIAEKKRPKIVAVGQ
jgi:hypothetical protein